MLPVVAAIEDTLLQLGLGGGALFVMFAILNPLVKAHIRTMEAFTVTQANMSVALLRVQEGMLAHSAMLQKHDDAMSARAEQMSQNAQLRHEQLLQEIRTTRQAS